MLYIKRVDHFQEAAHIDTEMLYTLLRGAAFLPFGFYPSRKQPDQLVNGPHMTKKLPQLIPNVILHYD